MYLYIVEFPDGIFRPDCVQHLMMAKRFVVTCYIIHVPRLLVPRSIRQGRIYQTLKRPSLVPV